MVPLYPNASRNEVQAQEKRRRRITRKRVKRISFNLHSLLSFTYYIIPLHLFLLPPPTLF
jgi:hypothetical protein